VASVKKKSSKSRMEKMQDSSRASSSAVVKRMKKDIYGLTKEEELIEFYRENPVEAARDILKIELNWFQRIALKKLWTRPYICFKWGRAGSKCQRHNDLAYDHDTGLFKKIGEFNNSSFTTLALGEGYKLVPAKAYVEENGVKPIFEVTLRSGRSIGVTDNHPFLKVGGWTEVKDLKVGDRVATARKLPEGRVDYPKNRAKLLGYLIGDGGITQGVNFTKSEKDILDDFRHCVLGEFDSVYVRERDRGVATTLYVSREISIGDGNDNEVITWLKELGLYGKKSVDKTVPDVVFQMNNESLKCFLASYFDCDGFVDHGLPVYSSSSKKLLQDVQRLLLRFGIVSNLIFKKAKCNGKEFDAWKLYILGGESTKLFYENIPIIFQRKKNKIRDHLEKTINSPNLDTVPKEIWDIYIEKFDIKLRSRKYSRSYRKRYSPTRDKLEKFGKEFGVDDAVDLANSDIYWDEVVDITCTGEEETYAVCVPGYENYLADTIITHNTWLVAVYCTLKAMLYSEMKIGVVAPSLRQTACVFDEIDRLFTNSPYFRASVRTMKYSNISYLLEFHHNSKIEGLPVGADGKKIRGKRYNIVILDEFNYHNEETINAVVKPFLMIRKGETLNQIVYASSPGYRTEHFWATCKRIFSKEKQFPHLYSLTTFNFADVYMGKTDYFLPDMHMISDAFESVPLEKFLMEYGGYVPGDISSFFSPHLIADCEPRAKPVEIEARADLTDDSTYIMGVDVARSPTGANFSYCILKLSENKTYKRIVKLRSFKGIDFPKQANIIRKEIFINKFNIEKIVMDYGGGGVALADILSYPWSYGGVDYPSIVPAKTVKDDFFNAKKVLPIMELEQFTVPFIDKIYTTLKADMEHRTLLFPPEETKGLDFEHTNIAKEISLLRSELIFLSTKPRAQGLTFEGHPKLGKDRATALALANYGASEAFKKTIGISEEEQEEEMTIGFWL